MKRYAFPLSFALLFLAAISLQAQQHTQGCQFNIAGTWQSSTNGQLNPTRVRFSSNGVMQELSRNTSGKEPVWQATSKAHFTLDNRKAPKALILTKDQKGGHLSTGAKLQIKTFDDGMFVTQVADDPGGALTRWTRIDPGRYFVVLAAGKGSPGFGAPGFAMLIKIDGVHTQTETFGTWPVVNELERHPMIGEIPEDVRKQFDNEPVNDAGAMLRLEVTAGPYNRALEVMKSWQRRAEENQLLYPEIPYLDNAVYLNQLTSSLNETGVLTWQGGRPCTETIKLQKLTWLLGDPIVAKHNLPQTPYYLFKTLRQLNSSLHLSDSQFQAALAGNHSATVAISSR